MATMSIDAPICRIILTDSKSAEPPAKITSKHHRSKSLTSKSDILKITDCHILAVQSRHVKSKERQAVSAASDLEEKDRDEKQDIDIPRLAYSGNNPRQSIYNKPRDMVLTPDDFLIEKGLMEQIKFASLIKLAFALLRNGYTLFGSFTHYLAWCAGNTANPEDSHTIKTFMETGRHIPRDIDVFDVNDVLATLDLTGFGTPTEVDKIVTYDRLSRFGGDHKKYKYTVDIPYIGVVYVNVDAIMSNNIHVNGLDFDINSLTFDNRYGFCSALESSNPSENDLLQRPMRVHRIIQKIVAQEAIFIGHFQPSDDHKTSRLLYVGRLRGMLAKGYTIAKWDLTYPLHTISNLDEHNKTCGICLTHTFANGDKAYLSPCCSAISKKLTCDECFWNTMKALTNIGRYYRCPYCRDEHIIFE